MTEHTQTPSAQSTKWRKRPVVVDAWRWTGRPPREELPEWLLNWQHDGASVLWDTFTGHMSIPTLEGLMTAHPGDWIIRGVNGELYPCKPDIFAKTYEPAEEGK
jgi:hypothetical protein